MDGIKHCRSCRVGRAPTTSSNIVTFKQFSKLTVMQSVAALMSLISSRRQAEMRFICCTLLQLVHVQSLVIETVALWLLSVHAWHTRQSHTRPMTYTCALSLLSAYTWHTRQSHTWPMTHTCALSLLSVHTWHTRQSHTWQMMHTCAHSTQNISCTLTACKIQMSMTYLHNASKEIQKLAV